jgi:hypothetical protein
MPQARIATAFGDININYCSVEELKTALKTLHEEADLIRNAATDIVPFHPRSPKPGCEHIYRFMPEGKVELLVSSSKALHLAVLALFAYHPEVVTPSQLEDATGLPEVVGKVLTQTLNKAYFRKLDESYGLTPEGFAFCQEKVLPGFPKPTPEAEQQ